MARGEENKILIIDDEKSNLLYLHTVLRPEYAVYAFKDGVEALEKVESVQPDLILLDIVMPGMDGYEVLAALKAREDTQSIPVIFITGQDSKADEERGLSAGVADYIVKPFSAAVVKLRVGNQIQIVNQLRTIERMSMTDPLTGIANRRSFDRKIAVEWRRAFREKHSLSLLMIDVDRFKVYNDSYGHQQGDVVLQSVAHILRTYLRRPADFTARWGGEEFAVLLPATEAQGAVTVAESIRASVEKTPIPLPDGAATSVTVSIGVNTVQPAQSDVDPAFVDSADTALYAAKEAGRNKVRQHTPIP